MTVYITTKGKKHNKTLQGYVIFEEKGIIEKLDPSGIRYQDQILKWSSYYYKNDSQSHQVLESKKSTEKNITNKIDSEKYGYSREVDVQP